MKLRLGCGILVLLLILGLAIAVLLRVRDRIEAQQPLVLADGSVIEFLGATFGTNHSRPGPRSFRRWIPPFVSRLLRQPANTSTMTTDAPVMIVWFNHMGLQRGMRRWDCSLVHPDGFESQFNSQTYLPVSTPTNEIAGIATPLPGRDRTVRVRVYDRITWKDRTPLGDLTIQNPERLVTTTWNSAPLPQTHRTNDFEVILASLVTGVPRRWSSPTNYASAHTVVHFQVRQRGVLDPLWSIQTLEAMDAMGNRIVSHTTSGQTEGEHERFECQPVLWPGETYKLRLELSPKVTASFATNDVWQIGNVPVPTNGSVTVWNVQTNLNGHIITFHGLTTAGGNPPWQEMFSGPSAGFSLSEEPKGFRFKLIGAVDDQGRRVESSGAGYSMTNYGFGLRWSNDVKSVTLRVALPRSHFAEFVAAPVRWTNSAGSHSK